MRNLVVQRDAQLAVAPASMTGIASACSNNSTGVVVVCTRGGHLVEVPLSEGPVTEWDIGTTEEGTRDESWFFCSSIIDNNSLLCLSRSGRIITIGHSSSDGEWDPQPEIEGYVDSGILAAQWNPDQSSLLLCTGDNSLIMMSPELEVLHEGPIPSADPRCPCAVSWSGDGEMCAILSVDTADGVPRIRLYSKTFDLLAVGRGVTEGPASIVKDLCGVVAFANNGALVAGVQKKTSGKFQVVFFERNGLRHGEFDVQLDHVVTDEAPLSSWTPTGLYFDLSSTVIAVCFSSTETVGECTGYNSVVQLYSRENFYWYLKQQWSGVGLNLHGFDSEISGRLYLSESISGFTKGHCVVRSIDLIWEATASPTSDCTIAVTDGVKIHMTPLGRAVVPPPMSLYGCPPVTAPPRHLSFWTVPPRSDSNLSQDWGLACLCDRNTVFLFFGEHSVSTNTSTPLRTSGQIDLSSTLQTAGLGFGSCKQILAIENRHQGADSPTDQSRTVYLALIVSEPRLVAVSQAERTFSQSFSRDLSQDFLLFIKIDLVSALAVAEYCGKVLMSLCTATGLGHWGAEGCCIPEISADGAFKTRNEMALDEVHHHVAVSVYTTDSSFSVIRVETPFPTQDISGIRYLKAFDKVISVSDSGVTSHIIPELCHKVIVAVPNAEEDDTAHNESKISELANNLLRRPAIIGLSMRNHLYCGEILIATGVSTFCLNQPLGTLMYATVGTRPTLNFVDIENLYKLDPMQSLDDLVQYWGASEPRPLERGARLVASVPATARVVLQMPRGNFETCEPRHLALKRACLMMETSSFFECLVFLRRQRIDLNLLFDYCPNKFLVGVPSLVEQCLISNPDMVSLLISSLEDGNVTRSKYSVDFTGVQSWTKHPVITYVDKVNIVCQAIRNGILCYILNLNKGDPETATTFDVLKYVNPILCTYAKQCPPRLGEALNIIKAESLGALPLTISSISTELLETMSSENDVLGRSVRRCLDSAEFVNAQPALSLGKPQALIKYLAFLVNKDDLFNASLGECDFVMSRAIAKQCQMDPKVYLPLIEEFESIGADWPKSDRSTEFSRLKQLCFMKFRVYMHLDDSNSAVMWGIRAISMADFPEVNSNEEHLGCFSYEREFYTDVFNAIEKDDLHMAAMKLIRDLLDETRPFSIDNFGGGANDASSLHSKSSIGFKYLSRLLSMVLISYGSRAVALGSYKEAVTAFLAAEPAELSRAITAAKSAKDWKLAISLAGRATISLAQRPTDNSPQSPKQVALSIIEEFEAGLEQGMSDEEDYFSTFPSNVDFSELIKPSDAAFLGEAQDRSTGTNHDDDRSLEAAWLCVEYLDGDLDRALAILIAGRKWVPAVQLAFKHCRSDLVQQVGENVRSAAAEALATLAQRAVRYTALCTNLKKCWADNDNRLKLIMESDPQLAKIVDREQRPAEIGWSNPGIDDVEAGRETRSVHNEMRSEFSRSSNMSLASGTSVRSGVSTVSILSNLSRSSNTGSTVSDASSFSVRGLEHSLLSRGNAYDTAAGGKSAKSIEKKKKRHERHLKGNKGGAHGGADIYNLKGENAWCVELCRHCDIKLVATAVVDLRDALLLLGDSPGDVDLASCLQREMTNYAGAIVATPPPPAPLYPVEWLRRKNMEYVRCFQEWPEATADTVQTIGTFSNTTVSSLLWWRIAAEGIIYWRSVKNCLFDV